MLPHPHRRDHRQEILGQQGFNQVGVDRGHLPHQADVDDLRRLVVPGPVIFHFLGMRSPPSLPDSPTARPPAVLTRLTISLLILPARTISTTSMVRESVTRRPSTKRVGIFIFQELADLGAAAVHQRHPDAQGLEQGDVLGEALLEVRLLHGRAAVFDDQGLPLKGQGLRR
jgi:hypothetical protein